MKVRLPRVEAGVPDARRESELPQRGTATVLVAEDEPLVRAQVTRILQGAGYTVLEAENGARAVELFREHIESIDLVVLDAIMPLCNGWQAYVQIRQLKPSIHGLFTTGYAANVLPADFMAHGARLLSKPFRATELLGKVRELLSSKRNATK